MKAVLKLLVSGLGHAHLSELVCITVFRWACKQVRFSYVSLVSEFLIALKLIILGEGYFIFVSMAELCSTSVTRLERVLFAR